MPLFARFSPVSLIATLLFSLFIIHHSWVCKSMFTVLRIAHRICSIPSRKAGGGKGTNRAWLHLPFISLRISAAYKKC